VISQFEFVVSHPFDRNLEMQVLRLPVAALRVAMDDGERRLVQHQAPRELEDEASPVGKT
jgi:hypothetical protein